MDKVGVGIIGSRFVAELHVESLKRVPDATIVATASPTEAHVREFAAKHGIPHWFTNYHELLARPDVDLVTIAAPNDLHCQIVCDAAAAGKHIICEKPLCRTMAEVDRMLEACRSANVKLMYAEELCFVPKYVRAKELIDSGAIGKLYLIKQAEKHDGPHSDWFWDVERSGGGVTLDMGCHAFQFFRWILNNPPVVAVTAQMGTYVHKNRTKGDDDAIIIVEFEGGVRGVAEESWAKVGGMDDLAEFYGSDGVIFANLLYGNAMRVYSRSGYDYAVEKAETTKGWSFCTFEEMWNYGFPQEMAHFVDCVKNDRQPLVTGEDGKIVMEIIYAAYASAGQGRRIELPFSPPPEAAPIDLWRS
ncbi:MAG: Gfo/Idh/MocA family protein [Candidatus Zipacnadales bacterium]